MSLMSLLKRPFVGDRSERRTIEAIYGMIVAQARRPAFYATLNVPDTVNGRFDMLLLHIWVVLRRLRDVAGGTELGQALFDRFCTDMDANLREMGVGDLTVPKRMQSFGEAFYGRLGAYDAAMLENEPEGALAAAFSRNILGRPVDGAGAQDTRQDTSVAVGAPPPQAAELAHYALAALATLVALPDAVVIAANWQFPDPVKTGASG
jgi:cytochrome b pre-mRNA-processing protein 3